MIDKRQVASALRTALRALFTRVKAHVLNRSPGVASVIFNELSGLGGSTSVRRVTKALALAAGVPGGSRGELNRRSDSVSGGGSGSGFQSRGVGGGFSGGSRYGNNGFNGRNNNHGFGNNNTQRRDNINNNQGYRNAGGRGRGGHEMFYLRRCWPCLSAVPRAPR